MSVSFRTEEFVINAASIILEREKQRKDKDHHHSHEDL